MGVKKSLRKLLKPFLGRAAIRREVASADAVVVSIKKSGRTWLRAMLTHVYHSCFATPANLLLDGGNHQALNPAAPSVLFAHDSDPVAPEGDAAADLPMYDGKKIILLVRHPADTAVSLYFHYKNRKTGRRQQLAAGSSMFDFAMRPGQGLHTIIAFLNRWAEYARRREGVMIVRYEDLRSSTVAQLGAIAAYLGASASVQDLEAAAEFASLDNLRKLEIEGFFDDRSMRKSDGKNPDAMKVRRGQVGGYRDYFTAEECRQIDALIAGKLDPSYGYGGAP